MGFDIENASEFRIEHTQPGSGSNDIRFRLHAHRGDQSIDTMSPHYGQANHDAFVTAAQVSQFAFDGAVTSVLGTWYSSLSAAFKQGFRENFTRQ